MSFGDAGLGTSGFGGDDPLRAFFFIPSFLRITPIRSNVRVMPHESSTTITPHNAGLEVTSA